MGELEIFKSRLQLNYEVMTSKSVPGFEETSIVWYLLAAFLACSAINLNKANRKIARTGRRVLAALPWELSEFK